MEVEYLFLEGLILVKPKIYSDNRGYFFESYNQKKIESQTGITSQFVQDNESYSHAGVLRGLHYQNPPYAQGKLIRVIRGSVLDVAVDIRKDSPTFGQHYKVVLSDKNKHQLYIPEGFAHGFLVLEDDTIFSYKCTQYYHPESEGSLRWNDPDINIDWGISEPVISEKDLNKSLFWSAFVSHF